MDADSFPGTKVKRRKKQRIEMKILTSATLIVCTVSAAAFASCSKIDNSTSAIKFNPTAASVDAGQIQKVLICGGSGTYTAKSGDAATATVSVDKDTLFVTGVKAGKATVIVTDSKNVTGNLSVTVLAPITVDKSQASIGIAKEETITISGGTTPYTATSKDEKIATATIADSKLTIKGVSEGNTTITIKDKNNKTATVTVTVTQ